MSEPARLTASAAARKIAAGELTCEQLVRACLERIEQRDSVVRAWSFVDAVSAIEQAVASDRSSRNLPLRGIPLGIKDVFNTAAMPTEHNSAIYRGHRPATDADCITVARNAGAVIVGKTVTSEFAYRFPGPTTNPLNRHHTPGGSSSGSAAAVADFMVPLAIGTQTGASTIRPATYCGIYGFKPTYGRVSFNGGKVLSASQDTIGLFARCVEDLALLDSVLVGEPFLASWGEWTSRLKIGICPTPFWSEADGSARHAFAQAAGALREEGVHIRDVDLPESFRQLADVNSRLVAVEAAEALAFEYREHREKLSPMIRELIEEGLVANTDQFQKARALQMTWALTIDSLFDELDALLTPAATGEAPEGLDSTGDPIFSRPWMPLHLPCIAIPVMKGETGLPVGIQLIGRLNHDRKLLAIAEYVSKMINSRL